MVTAVLLVAALGAASCSKTPENAISQAEYDSLQAQLSAAQAKISELESKTPEPTVSANELALKDEVTALQAQIDDLGNDIKTLNDQNDTLTKEKTSLETQYADLNTKYSNLLKTIATTTTPVKEELTEAKVEDEIFRLLNEERLNAGVPEFVFGKNLYTLARLNSRNMARIGKFDYDVSVYYQEVFWGINYETIDAIATAALKTWMLNQYRFNSGALLNTNKYGAVGAYYEDGVFFVTFMAAGYP
jgi:hypothetical protein